MGKVLASLLNLAIYKIFNGHQQSFLNTLNCIPTFICNLCNNKFILNDNKVSYSNSENCSLNVNVSFQFIGIS